MVFTVLILVVVFGLILVGWLLLNEKKNSSDKEVQIETFQKENAELARQNADLARQVLILTEENKPSREKTRQNIAQFIHDTTIENIMVKNVVSIDVNAHFSDVPRLMNEYHIRHLPVVDDGKRLVGLITQGMLFKIAPPHKILDSDDWQYNDEMLNGVILKHVMLKDVVTIHPTESMGKALTQMTYTTFGSMPVIDNNRHLIGIVTRKDILKVAANVYRDHFPEEK